MRNAILAPVTLAVSCLLATSCDWNSKDDYSPKKGYQQFTKEQEEAKAAAAKAGAGGGAAAVAVVPGKQTYETFCVACHGVDGKADGPGAVAMNPRPRNLTDKAWQGKVDDAHIAKVIKEGGAAVGLSATMAPWGAAINDEEIKNVVAYVRQLGK
ncbi:MAG TPA: cytochrome c [Oligoflexus sp.]|uniref:c-type cytochrome n=1 Tax=Oligoflexus sp. TaxID=1971216 RepID=UPI002D5FE363|nr:cytochrome c [Oligoflexus sp.]HYX38620.1 cytochrome c [Oligoflexus sp.]